MKENLINDNAIRPSVLDPIPDEDEKTEWEKKSCCGKCCHYMFCCCCCVKYENTKNFYKKGWRKYLKKEGHDASDQSFQILTNLFANADRAIESLENIRLNPNLVSEKKLRNDLEFYIPQLCTFLLFGEVKAIEEFFVFLCKVCNASFFFAHRVQWFLSAMINSSQEKREDIISTLKMVNTLFKSEDKKKRNKLDKFYITNSETYIKYIKNNDLYYLYDTNYLDEKNNIFDKIDFNSLNMFQQQIYNRYKENRELIIKFSEEEYKTAKQKQLQKLRDSGKIKNISNNKINEKNIDTSDINLNKKQFRPNDFYIDISNFKLNNEDVSIEDDEILEVDENEEDVGKALYGDDFVNLDKKPLDINFISYHSTLNFIDHLCDISNELPKYPIDEQQIFLYKKLKEINKKLPCNVYLPFLKDSTRNYLICHIPLEGVKIFRTKTRCPIMLTFEMIRMDEINKEIMEDDVDEDYPSSVRSKSISSSGSGLILDDDKLTGKKNRKLLNDIIREDTTDYNNADYDLSKPLLLNKAESGEDSFTTYKAKKAKLPKKPNSDDIKDTKNEQKFLNIINRFRNKNQMPLRDLNKSKTIFFEPKKNPLSKDNNISNNTKDLANKLIQKNKENDESKLNVNGINDVNPEDALIPEKEIQPIDKSRNPEEFKNIFGTTFEEKEKNLKKTSLFGKFKSHKIFTCIFKTHEDLRQEQFATQLINEFNQIFKIEDVKCWLNTYEIISTGNDAGLVEMVNDSLSLDQLKQKLNNIPLRDFYLYYWGKGRSTSPEYKKAMSNFVSSLAGYSLVCYFLQIKDRHNGNILIDNEGHIAHIDFGFLLSNAPGKGLKFENAPFKLSRDMVQCLGGNQGVYFDEFRKLLKKGFLAVHKHRKKIIILVEMMWCGHGRNLDCFEKGQEAINELKQRLAPKECVRKKDVFKFVDRLIEQSVDNWRTKWYDIFQYYVQGIFY